MLFVLFSLVISLTVRSFDSHFRKKQLEQFAGIGIGSTSTQVKDAMGFMYDDYLMDPAHQEYLQQRLPPASIDLTSDRVFHYKAGWVRPNRLILFFKNDLLTKKSIVP